MQKDVSGVTPVVLKHFLCALTKEKSEKESGPEKIELTGPELSVIVPIYCF